MTPRQTLEALVRHFRLPERVLDPGADLRLPVEIPGATRVDLAKFLGTLGAQDGAEIGVMEGEYSEALCQAIPGVRLLCVDPYTVREDYYAGRGGKTQADFDAYRRAAMDRLDPYGCTFVAETSREAALGQPLRSLDFVYIDGHHNFQNVTNDICDWSLRVKVGGIIAGHDYYATRRPGFGLHVKHVVDAFTAAYAIRPWFVLGRKDPPAGEPRDDHRSFVWVNEETGLEHGR